MKNKSFIRNAFERYFILLLQGFALLYVLRFVSFQNTAQESGTPVMKADSRRPMLPIWTYQDKNRDIYGLSLGIHSRGKFFNTRTNGLRIEAVGIGIILSMMPHFPENNDSVHLHIMSEPARQIVNGVNLSPLGSMCFCDVNGISLGGWGQWMRSVNGFSASLFMHLTERHHGISFGAWNVNTQTKGLQLAIIYNQSMSIQGMQIGLFNKAYRLQGFQIGLWNVNAKRKLPLLNWSF